MRNITRCLMQTVLPGVVLGLFLFLGMGIKAQAVTTVDVKIEDGNVLVGRSYTDSVGDITSYHTLNAGDTFEYVSNDHGVISITNSDDTMSSYKFYIEDGVELASFTSSVSTFHLENLKSGASLLECKGHVITAEDGSYIDTIYSGSAVNNANGTCKDNRGSIVCLGGTLTNNYGESAQVTSSGHIYSNYGSISGQNNGTVEINASGATIATNYTSGTVKINKGDITTNDNGDIGTNYGSISNNNGFVTKNVGTIAENKKMVYTNLGEITVNSASGSSYGVKDNKRGAVIVTNSSKVFQNEGTVTTNNGDVYKNSGDIGGGSGNVYTDSSSNEPSGWGHDYESEVTGSGDSGDSHHSSSKHHKKDTASKDYTFREVNGEMVYGGDVNGDFAGTTMIPASAYPKYIDFAVKKLEKALLTADTEGEASEDKVVLKCSVWNSFSRKLMEAVQNCPKDVELIYRAGDGNLYLIVVPADADIMQYVDENGYCGLAYLGLQLGQVPYTE